MKLFTEREIRATAIFLPLALLVNILGGPSANSRLNVSLREKNGLSYNIEASYTPYNDCGLAAIYFSSDHSNADHCRELIDRELDALRRTKLTRATVDGQTSVSGPDGHIDGEQRGLYAGGGQEFSGPRRHRYHGGRV